MRVALLKDPEIRERIIRPMPLPEAPDESDIDPEAPTADT
jgi:penicillin-binding protein 2